MSLSITTKQAFRFWIILLTFIATIYPQLSISQDNKITNEVLERIFNRAGICGLTNYNSLPAVYHLDPILYDTDKGKAFLHSKIVHGEKREKHRAINLLLRGNDEKVHEVLIYLFKQNNKELEVASKLKFIDQESVINLLNTELNKVDKSNYDRIHGIIQSIFEITSPRSIPYIEQFLVDYKKDNRLRNRAKHVLNFLINFNKDKESRLSLYAKVLFEKLPKGAYADDFRILIRKLSRLNDRSFLTMLRNGIRQNPAININNLRSLIILRSDLGDKRFTKAELLILKQHKKAKKQQVKRFKKALKEVKRHKNIDTLSSNWMYDF